MDKLYDNLFDLTDYNQAHYYQLIPTIDVKIWTFKMWERMDLQVFDWK